MNTVAPAHNFNLGAFIRAFQKEFAQELRERNFVHHQRRFEDLALDRIFLTESMANAGEHWDERHQAAYRKFAKVWARRVQSRGEKLDEFLEAIASVTLATCGFLSTNQLPDAVPTVERSK